MYLEKNVGPEATAEKTEVHIHVSPPEFIKKFIIQRKKLL
jgi:hypothetical protein